PTESVEPPAIVTETASGPDETGGPPPVVPPDLTPEFDRAIEAVAELDLPPEAEHPGESVRRHALGVLDRALRMRSRDGLEFAPLTACLDRLGALRRAVAEAAPDALPVEALGLARGEHPVVGLLSVIEGVDGLDDAGWADLHARVTEAFGRPLAVAAAR